jgi:hypothetical protein
MNIEDLAKKISKDQLKNLLLNKSDDRVDMKEEDREALENYKNGVYDFIVRLEELQERLEKINESCNKIK